MKTLRLQRDPMGFSSGILITRRGSSGRHSLAANPDDRAFFDSEHWRDRVV